MKSKAYAIMSPSQEKLIGEYLKYYGSSNRMSYYVLYYLIIETGIKYKQASSLRVKDVKGKDSIDIYFNCTEGHRTVQFSKDLKNKLDEFIKNRPPKEYLFLSSDGITPLSSITFQNALKTVGKKLKMDTPLTILTLRKTYFYHCYQYKKEHGSYKDEGSGYISSHTDQWVEEYLGIKEPTPKNKILLKMEKRIPRQKLYEDDYGKHFIKDSISKLNKISQLLDEPYLSDDECEKILLLINKLDAAFILYKEED